jgi:hypothetical protein
MDAVTDEPAAQQLVRSLLLRRLRHGYDVMERR